MQHFEKPKIVVLEGEEAIKILNDYIHELKEGSAEELAEEQTRVMIKAAEGLMQTSQDDTLTQESSRKAPIPPKIVRIARRLVSRELAEEFLHSPVDLRTSTHHRTDK